MAKFYIAIGSFLFVASVISLFPAAKFFLGELHFYFFFIFGPFLLISMAMIFVGAMLQRNAKPKRNQSKEAPNK